MCKTAKDHHCRSSSLRSRQFLLHFDPDNSGDYHGCFRRLRWLRVRRSRQFGRETHWRSCRASQSEAQPRRSDNRSCRRRVRCCWLDHEPNHHHEPSLRRRRRWRSRFRPETDDELRRRRGARDRGEL